MKKFRIPLIRCWRSCSAARQLSLLGSRGAIATIAHTSFTLSRRSRQIPATGTRAFSSASQANKGRNCGFIFSLGAVTAFLSLSVYLYHSDTGLVRMGLTTGSHGCVDDNPSQMQPSIVLSAVRGGHEPISKAVASESAGDEFPDISSLPKEVAVLTSAPNVPPSITRKHPVLLQVELATETKLAQLTSQYKYEQWTFNGTVPGPFIRARVGDVVELTLTNKDPTGNPHNIDCHAFTGPGGGAAVTTVEENEPKTARFKLLYPGLYFYHCAAAPVPVHIANGMYGLMYVQPEEDLPPVDKEYYVMQSEFYHEPPEIDDDGRRSDTVEFSYPNGLREEPNVIAFNGSESALTRDKPLKANVGDSVRIFFGNAGPNLTSAFHVIGSHFKKVYRDGDVISPPGRAIQTITVPPGSASIVDLKMLVPGTYSLIDHAMFRLDKGAVGFLNVSGKPEPNVYESEQPPKPCPAFDDKLTPLVSFGLPFPQACCKHLKTNFKRPRVYIIASASLSKNTSYVDQLKSALEGLVVGVRIGISPHTPISEIVDILADVKDLEIDCIVTLGAGSITDGAKLVRFAFANQAWTEKEIDTLWGGKSHNPNKRDVLHEPTALLICIPTSLSGAEYQAIAGATDTKSKAKRVFEPMLGPNLVIQDPQLATTTPQKTWLSSGIRAIDHCVEILCSLKSNAVADEWAARGLDELISGLLRSKHEPEDLDARHLCQKGVMKAMRAVSCDVPLGASHAIGHQLGPLGVGHGETSCILLPEVCKFNARKGANTDRQKQTVEVLLKKKDVKSILAKADASSEEPDLGDVLDLIIRELGMPRTLEAVGVTPDSFKILAANSLSDLWIKTNAYPITRGEEVIEILEAVSGP